MSALRILIVAFLFAIVVSACGGDGGAQTATPIPSDPTHTAAATASPASTPRGLPADRVTFYGADAGDQASAIVAGDFNGDGITDIALGAAGGAGPDNNRPAAGEVYVFYGPFAPGSTLDAGARQYDTIFYGAAAGDGLARTLVAGDFNGDGTDDLAIAAPSAVGAAGRVYVMFGGAWPQSVDFASTDPDVLLNGVDPNDFAGFTLASADLNGDGKDDLLVGAMLADGPQNTRPDAGEVHVFSGASLIAGSTFPLSDASGTIFGAKAGDRLGEGLTTGDVTGDGKPDIVAVSTFGAAPGGSRAGAGLTYVIASPAKLPLDLATGGAALEVVGADAGDQLGHSVGAGDANGDGAADLWLGAVSADGPNNTVDLAGEAALVTGKRAPGTVIDAGAGQADAIIYGPATEARLGRSLAVGDVTGDHLADLAISAPNLDARAGRVFIVKGGATYPANAADAGVTLFGQDPADTLGFEALGEPSLSISDVNGDGRADVLVSAVGGDGPNNARADCGEAYVIWSTSLGG